MLDLGNHLYLLGLSLLNICSLENVWIQEGVALIYFTWFSILFVVDDYFGNGIVKICVRLIIL